MSLELIKYAKILPGTNELTVIMIEDYSDDFESNNVNFEFEYPIIDMKNVDNIPEEVATRDISSFISGGSESNRFNDNQIDIITNNIKKLHDNKEVMIFLNEDLSVTEFVEQWKHHTNNKKTY